MRYHSRFKLLRACSRRTVPAGLILATAVYCTAAFAQAPTKLPPIIVKGATIDVAPAKPQPQAAPQAAPQPVQKTAPQPAPAPTASSTAQPAPSASAPQPQAAGGGGGSAAASTTAATAAAGGTATSGTATSGTATSGTATTSSSGGGIAIDEIGAAVSVVTGAQLRAGQIRHAVEALRSLPGVSVGRTGSVSGLTQVRLRGGEGNHTLVIIDGVRANDTTNGEFDFSDLSAEDIERIEVIRGPQSGLYGSNALGGVINIVTKSGRGPLALTLRGEGGSLKSKDGLIRLSGGNDDIWGSVSYHVRDTAGFNISEIGGESDETRHATFSFKAGFRIAESVVLDVTVRDSFKRGNYDEFGGTSGFQAAFDADNRLRHHVLLGAASLRWDMFDGALTHEFKATHNKTTRQDVSATFFGANDSLTRNLSYAGTYRLDTAALLSARHFVTGLLEQGDERFTPKSSFADGLDRRRARVSYAGEYRGQFAKQLFVTGTVRHDDNDTFKDYTTWHASATLKIPQWGLRPHASVGTAVKNPTMFEQFGSIPAFFTPNPNLVPEESFGWDAGLELTNAAGSASLDITYFNQDLTNKINGFAPGPAFTFTSENQAGKSTREGVEVFGRIKLSPELTLAGSYTYLDAKTPADIQEIRRAPHSGKAELTYAFDEGRGTFNLAAVYNGDMTDIGRRVTGLFFGFPIVQLETVDLDSYWLVRAAASYKITPEVELFGRVENALDQDYQEVFGFNTPGIAAYAGLRFKFAADSDD